jgi:hypothetical protein
MKEPKSIEEAAYLVASDFQIKAICKDEGPVDAFSSINVQLPNQFPNDWRACDFMSLVKLTKEGNDE